MRVTCEVEGIDDVLAKFGGMISSVDGPNFTSDMEAMAESLVEKIKANTPVAMTSHTPPGHEPGTLRDKGIGYHLIKHGGLTAVYIGFTAVGFYGAFIEFGTVNMAAHPFVIPTLDQNRDAIVQAISDAYGNGFYKIL